MYSEEQTEESLQVTSLSLEETPRKHPISAGASVLHETLPIEGSL